MRSRPLNRFLFAAALCSTAWGGQALRAQSGMASWPSPFAEPSVPASNGAAPEPVHEFRSLLGPGSQVSGKPPANGLSVGVLQPPPNRVFSTVAYPQAVGAAPGAPSTPLDSLEMVPSEIVPEYVPGLAISPGNTPLGAEGPLGANIIAPFTMQTTEAVEQGCPPAALYPGPEGWYNNHVRPVPFEPGAFLPTPIPPKPANPYEEELTYRGKYAVPVQRPWVEWWRPFYVPGTPPPARATFGPTNLLNPHFMVYGDYRTGVGINRNAAGRLNSWAHRLNLDMDLQLTATERIHGFMGPLDDGANFTRLDFTDSAFTKFEGDARFDTLFFEGDLGAIAGGFKKTSAPFDLPFTFGLVPLLYQNGIWMQDAVLGAAFAIPSRNSSTLRWSNFDATFFAAVDQINSDAFKGSNSAAEMIGTAWFIEAYEGYIEFDYAYLHDDVGLNRSYNNLSAAYTRRYLDRLSNSVRVISNFGQELPDAQKTADGYLLLVENSLISFLPNRFVPYCNLFYGSGKPQPAARVGGPLQNTGINFESDGLTGYPTLDATGHNTYGGALGLNIHGVNYYDQLILELAALGTYGSAPFRQVAGDQYATGVRYQRPITNAWLMRLDAMYGILDNARDIQGVRGELRWKF